jgi:Fe-S-cluster containining protein
MSSRLEDESDPAVARRNATANFDRLLSGLSPSAVAREDQLLGEIKAVRGSTIKKLRHLHRVVENLGAEIAPFVACKRGCNACCHYNVQLFPIEAELIEKHTGSKQTKAEHPAKDFTGRPCVFLKQGECSIYDIRPMVCRKHVALTNTAYWCAPERSDAIALAMVSLSQVDAAFEHIVRLDGRTSISDIRQSFSGSS